MTQETETNEPVVEVTTEAVVETEEVVIEEVATEKSEQVAGLAAITILQAAAILIESKLPTVAVNRLAENEYADEGAWRKAIKSEREYLDAARGDAKLANVVFGNTVKKDVQESAPADDKDPDQIISEYLGYKMHGGKK